MDSFWPDARKPDRLAWWLLKWELHNPWGSVRNLVEVGPMDRNLWFWRRYLASNKMEYKISKRNMTLIPQPPHQCGLRNPKILEFLAVAVKVW